MTDIIKQAEKDREMLGIKQQELPSIISIPDAIEHAASVVAVEAGAKAIICITNSGKAALALSKFRPKVPIFAITDRKEAIRTACHLAKSGDIILLAGKGHEKYQEIAGVKYPFDDKQVLIEFLNQMN
jgi:pyruvate kinase